jgi:hypothetical protein
MVVYMSKKGKARKGTMFGEAKNKWLADIITLESPKGARQAVNALKKNVVGFNRELDKLVKRATVVASNRANAMQLKEDISKKEINQLKRISKIYINFANKIDLSKWGKQVEDLGKEFMEARKTFRKGRAF